MSEIIFDWMDFYQAFANRLLDYKNNRKELIVKFKKIYVDANIKWSCLEKDFEGNFIDPSDIDPFTVVGVFNRRMRDENRFKVINVVKEEFSISEEIPTNFAGIPRIQANSPRFYAYEPNGRQEDDIDNLWEVFEAAINYSSNPHNEHYRNEFIKWFNKVKDQKGVGLSNFTSGLFWIRPYTFINLDSRNLKFITDSNLFSDDLVNEVKSINGFPSGELYLKICEECSLVIEDSDYENLVDFSYHAFLNDVKGETDFNENDIILKRDFEKVMDEYLDAKDQIGTTKAPIADYITNDIRQHFNGILDSDKYSCESSAGQSTLAEIPRIEFGIKNKTNENHADVAYLFRSDMSGVYLVLRTFHDKNIGKKYGNYLHQHLKTKSMHIQDFIKVYGLKTDGYQESIDLLSNNNTAQRYTVSTIYSKFYEKSNIPSDDMLVKDLLVFLNMCEIVLDNYSDNMYLTADEWVAALEDANLIDSRMLNVLEIMYNCENHTSCYTDIADVRHKLGFVDEQPMTYNTPIVYTSRKLKEHFNKTALYNKDNKEEYWSRLFYGEYKKHENGKRLFYFTLRDELAEALEKYDKTKRPDRIVINMKDKDYGDSGTTRYWLIAAGEDSVWWDDFKQNNEIGINFPPTGDINQYETRDEIRRVLQEANNDDKDYKNKVNACWQFAHDMQIGDVVFVKHRTGEIIGRGIIESDYKFDSSKPYNKFRKINWTHEGNWDYEGSLPQKALTDITNKHYLEIIKKFFENKEYDSFYDYLMDEGYYFSRETIENYLLSLKVKPFVILTGNSGTGKTKLSQLFAQYLNQNGNYKIIPVGANWTENRHILGYFNIIKNEAQYTPAYHLIERSQEYSYPHFLILDEMNLSHVERYFADFLSAIESGENIPLHGNEELEIPHNLFIIGTVNVDETTYMFSPKVLDRANTIEFETYSAKDYMTHKFKSAKPEGNIEYLEDILADREIQNMSIEDLEKEFDNDEFWQQLSDEIFKFQEILKKSSFDFGFRVINEIVRFMLVAYKYEGYPDNWANWKRYFDAQIKQKMLPKLHGSQKIIGETLDELLQACAEYPTSKAKLKEMIDVLDKQRYVSFIN